MDKVFVVKRLAEQLWTTERAIDVALCEATKLMSGVVAAPEEVKVAPCVADQAVCKLSEATAALAHARHAMLEAHTALNEAKLRIGVRTRMDGPHPKQAALDVEPAVNVERQAS